MSPKYKGMKKTTRYKHIIKMANSRTGRESITPAKYGSYRDIQQILKVSPNTISEAFKKNKPKRKRGSNLKKGQYDGDLGRIKGSYSRKP